MSPETLHRRCCGKARGWLRCVNRWAPGSGVPWLRELRNELLDAAGYSLLGRWEPLARRLLCVTGRVQARMDGEVQRG